MLLNQKETPWCPCIVHVYCTCTPFKWCAQYKVLPDKGELIFHRVLVQFLLHQGRSGFEGSVFGSNSHEGPTFRGCCMHCAPTICP